MSESIKSGEENSPTHPKYNFHGRRLGRGLKDHQKIVLEETFDLFNITLPADGSSLKINETFGQNQKHLTLEIGSGGGEHCAALAAQEPSHAFIAAEAYLKGIASLLGHIKLHQINNIRFYANDVRLLWDQLPPACLDRVIILFADPWPKTRHHERRMVQIDNLKCLLPLMKPGAEVRIATDHAEYLQWMIEHLKKVPELSPQFSWDTIPLTRPAGWPPTRYEQKALKVGRSCAYMVFKKI